LAWPWIFFNIDLDLHCVFFPLSSSRYIEKLVSCADDQWQNTLSSSHAAAERKKYSWSSMEREKKLNTIMLQYAIMLKFIRGALWRNLLSKFYILSTKNFLWLYLKTFSNLNFDCDFWAVWWKNLWDFYFVNHWYDFIGYITATRVNKFP
jgi:hypothetical protein